MMSTDNESPRILRVAETASTNSLLRELVIKESLAEGSVVVASDSQVFPISRQPDVVRSGILGSLRRERT